MPRPIKDENREAFLHRFMASDEARKDYPEEKQRFAVATSTWEARNELEEAANSLGYNSEKEGAEPFAGRHIQPGVVAYPEMQHPVTGKSGISILVEKDVLDAMRASFKGIPVINWKHDFSGGAEHWIKDGKAVGVCVGSRWDGEAGWECCEYFLWDREGKANARNGFRLSNAWRAEDVDWTPGKHNGVDYDGRLKAARYTHLALVTNPRYEGAETYANGRPGLGENIMRLFGIGKKESIELSKDAVVKIAGKEVAVLEVANAVAAIEAEKGSKVRAASAEIGAEDEIEVNGKKYKGLEITNALAALEKAKTAAPEPAKATVEGESVLPKTAEEFANALSAEREKTVAMIAEKLDGLKGDSFFEAVNQIIEKGKQKSEAAPARHLGQKARVARGSEKYGKRAAEAKA